MFAKKATKIDEIFTVEVTLCSKCEIDGEDLVNFCGILRKHKLYFTSIPNPKYRSLDGFFKSLQHLNLKYFIKLNFS